MSEDQAIDPPPERHERADLGVVFERRRIAHPWQEWRWRPVAVIPGASPVSEPRLLREGEDWAWLQLATLPLELFPGETADYRVNLSQTPPLVYVLWHEDGATPGEPPDPFHVTVCHSETQDYLDGGDVRAEGVPMPAPIEALLAAYVRAYHIDVPFKKRKRSPLSPAGGRAEEDG